MKIRISVLRCLKKLTSNFQREPQGSTTCMIYFLKGVLAAKFPGYAEIDVQGVGYGVLIPVSTYDRLPEIGQVVQLRTYLHVREEVMSLYGFQSEFEKEVFLLLNTVSGIGPKAALGIMSVLSVSEIEDALLMAKPEVFSRVPGIGKKSAEKIIVELKDRMGKHFKISRPAGQKMPSGQGVLASVADDVFMGLTQLGFQAQDARKAIDLVLKDHPESNDPSMLLKESISLLTQRKK